MRRWHRQILVLAAAVTLVLPVAPAASAAPSSGSGVNPVIAWDLNADTAIWDVARQQPNVQGRSFAMVNGAVYDAVNAIAGTPYEPYLTAPRVDGTESVDAAVGTAAHRVLVSLFPDQGDRLRASTLPTPGPPALTSGTYARDVNEVKLIGRATGSTRTPDQTEAAVWWHDRDSVLSQVKRQLATTRRLSVLRTARLFAMVDLIGADAAIACFAQKEAWSFWRPVTAIRLADTDGNPRTEADPDWLPLLVTPPFPEYPSGHACGTAARMTTYAEFFGRDRIPFGAYSVDADATRQFTSFSGALAELLNARVWGGVHFRTADVHGADLGTAVARYAVTHHFRPRR